jgi:hypothetical protein
MCKATIIRLRISEVSKQGKHKVTAILSTLKLKDQFSSLRKTFADIVFGKYHYDLLKNRKTY